MTGLGLKIFLKEPSIIDAIFFNGLKFLKILFDPKQIFKGNKIFYSFIS